MNAGQSAKAPFNFTTVLTVVLGYERYLRLMGLLFVFGLLLGLSVYIYKRGQYASRSVIRFYGFVDPATAASGAKSGGGINYRAVRTLIAQLSGRNFQLQTVRTIGAVGKGTSWEELRQDVLPGMRVSLLDEAHFQVDVYAYLPEVVEKYPQAMLETFYSWRQEQRRAYREEAVSRYVKELEEVRAKMNEQLEKRLQFEEASAIAEVKVELDNLSRLPVEMIRVRHVLGEMERTRALLDRWKDQLDIVGKLSLLAAVPKYGNGGGDVGRVLRPSDRAKGQVTTATGAAEGGVTLAPVVIQPDMVKGLEKWEELEVERRRLLEELGEAEGTFLTEHPSVLNLRAKLAEVDRGLERELSIALKAFDLEFLRLQEELANIEKSLPAYYEATRQFDETTQEYDMLEGGRMAWSKAFASLSAEVEKLDFSVDREAIEFENLGFTRLENKNPVSPSKKGIATQGLAIALALSFGVPFLLMRMSSTVTQLEQVERAIGVRGLGIVALAPGEQIEVSRLDSGDASERSAAFLENFRIIRTQILLDSDVSSKQVIVVTSPKPGDGKTTISANIAWSFASMGERVLLVDCDLRRGRIHRLFNLDNSTAGITHFLNGTANADSLIQSCSIENLSVVTRGLAIGGAADSLNSQRFKELCEKWRQSFDRIIFDSPPMLGLSDTTLIQDHGDGVVLVASYDTTVLDDIATCASVLRKLKAHIFGLVLNRVDFAVLLNAYRYYYYSTYYYDDAWGGEGEEGAEGKQSGSEAPVRRRRQA